MPRTSTDEALLAKRCVEMMLHTRFDQLFRSVLSVKCESVRIANRDWFAVHVLGDSFVYHQIRHIIGCARLALSARMIACRRAHNSAIGVVLEGLLPRELLPMTLRPVPFPLRAAAGAGGRARAARLPSARLPLHARQRGAATV